MTTTATPTQTTTGIAERLAEAARPFLAGDLPVPGAIARQVRHIVELAARL